LQHTVFLAIWAQLRFLPRPRILNGTGNSPKLEKQALGWAHTLSAWI